MYSKVDVVEAESIPGLVFSGALWFACWVGPLPWHQDSLRNSVPNMAPSYLALLSNYVCSNPHRHDSLVQQAREEDLFLALLDSLEEVTPPFFDILSHPFFCSAYLKLFFQAKTISD